MNHSRFLAILLLIVMLTISACSPSAADEQAGAPGATPSDQSAAPGAGESGEGAQGGQVSGTVVFWHAYNEVSPEGKMLTETLIPLFEEQNPGINVESQSVANEQLRQKLLTSIAGGAGPDVVRADIIWVPELAQAGALARLDELMDDFDELKGKVYEGPLSTNFWNGGYYGLPLDTNTKVWLWNKELYSQGGLNEPPATTDGVLEQCRASKDQLQGKSYYAEAGTGLWNMLPWIWSFGGDVTDENITKASGFVNGAQTVAAYDFFLTLFKEGCLAQRVLGGGLDPADGFAADQYASFIDGPWMYPIFAEQFSNKQLNAVPMPAGEGGSINVVGGENIVLMESSQNKEAALEFIRFTQSEEYQSRMAETGQMPVLPSVADQVTSQQAFYGPFFEALDTARARPPHPAYSRIDQIMTDTGQAILREQKTPQQALDEAAAQIDQLLASGGGSQ